MTLVLAEAARNISIAAENKENCSQCFFYLVKVL